MADSDATKDRVTPAAVGERPTLKTIARLTGMAVPTVSRALNDAPDIGRETKERVRAAARQVGYRPNRAGVRLRTGKTNVVSLVMSADHDIMNHTARLITSVAASLRNTPYHMIVTPYFFDQDPMEPVRYIVETGSADAVIMNQTTPEDPRVAYLMEHSFPFATHGRTRWADDHAYYDFNNESFAHYSVSELSRRGRRNILLVFPPQNQSYGQHMSAGALRAAQEKGVVADRLTTAVSDDAGASIQPAITDYLRAHPETDAILCAATTACMAATAAAEGVGLTLGEEIDIVAKEAIPFLKQFRAGILCMYEDVGRAGTFVTRAAIDRIENPDGPPMQHLEQPTKLG